VCIFFFFLRFVLAKVDLCRWGRHYLPSLRRAHQLQQCNNFKDPGIQHYGGRLFKQTRYEVLVNISYSVFTLHYRDAIEKIFSTLPAPKPSKGSYTYLVSMSTYHNCQRPCFDGDCTVLMANNNYKLIKDLKKGDTVMTPSGIIDHFSCI
jgi:hypothetical protein